MRPDAGEAVGDGLLLCFLEGKSVVQRAGDKVGQRAQKENFLLGEVHGYRGLDVQNAMELFGVKTGKAMAATESGNSGFNATSAGEAERYAAMCPLRATWPIKPAPREMRCPSVPRRCPASAWITTSRVA